MTRATDHVRLELAAVVREHPATQGKPARQVDDLIDRLTEAAYRTYAEMTAEEIPW